MTKENLSTDVYMTTEHKRKQLKAKTSFSMVMNKVLVGAILLSTLANSATPVYAASSLKDKYNDLGTISSNYEVSVEGAIYNVKSITSAIETMKSKGTVNQDILQELASPINTLEKAVSLSGKAPTQAVIDVIKGVEQAVMGLEGKGVVTVEAAIIAAKQKLGIKTTEIESNNIKVENTKATKAVKLTDISKHWGKVSIERLVGMDAIAGYPDSTFRPDNTISFAEFLKIAVSSVEKNVKASPQGTHWASGVYQTAIEKGILSSHEFQGTKEVFDAPISREDMALILVRLNEKSQGNSKVDTSTTKGMIQDYSKISANKTYFVEQAYQKKLLSGKGNGFDPKGNLTRAEASTAVVNLLDYKPDGAVVTPPGQESIYVEEGKNAGKVKTAVATEYHYKALKTAKFTKENGKYFISITLPELPEGIYWDGNITIMDKENSFMYTSTSGSFVDVKGTLKFEIDTLNDKNINNVDAATLSVKVWNDKGDMVSHALTTKNGEGGVIRQSTVSTSDRSWDKFDTTGIFNWK